MRTYASIIAMIFLCCPAFAQSQIIADLNPTHFKQDFSQYDQSTALFLAQLSEAAYWNDYNIRQLETDLNTNYPSAQYRLKLSDDRFRTFDNQVLLIGTKDYLVLAFRGTEPRILEDWLSDAKYWTYENSEAADKAIKGLPAGHGGFRRAMMRLLIEKKLMEEVDQMIAACRPEGDKKTFPVYLTGHSLGAALSQMFMLPLSLEHRFAGAYHFAPPLAVSCSANAEMKSKFGSIVYDIVNYKDYVPRAGRNDVAHFGKFYRICNDGLVYKEAEAYVKFNLSEYFSEFNLHSLDTHIKHLRNPANDIASINTRSAGAGDFPCMELEGKAESLCH